MADRYLIENTATGERQEVYYPTALGTDEVNRGVIPTSVPVGMAMWDGSAIVADAATQAAQLQALEKRLHAQIDYQAGQFREQFITSIPGQETTYRLKEDEARSWTSGADPANFPYLNEEATRRGVSIDDVAALVIQLADQWRALNPKIEGTRVATKDAVTAAQTAVEKEAAAVVDWEALLTQ